MSKIQRLTPPLLSLALLHFLRLHSIVVMFFFFCSPFFFFGHLNALCTRFLTKFSIKEFFLVRLNTRIIMCLFSFLASSDVARRVDERRWNERALANNDNANEQRRATRFRW